MMRAIQPSSLSKLDAVAFDALLREQDPFGAPVPRFDLSGVRFITPAALVQLAAACHALDGDGRRPTITLSGTAVPSYLLRSNFVNVVRPVARFNPPFKPGVVRAFDHLHGSNGVLIEVTKIETGAALPALLEKVVRVLREQLHYRKEDAYDVAVAVSEVGQNTFEHNHDAPTCGFLAMQVYGRDPRRFLEIGVADIGAGLARTLRRNPKHAAIASDFEAIQHAALLGTSQHDDPTRGTGLFHLVETAYKHAGSVQLRSGDATIRYRMDKKQGWGFAVAPMPGVHVALTLPAK
jgi:anti-sigma regulatory factor (Ser/Thr protein kinase)